MLRGMGMNALFGVIVLVGLVSAGCTAAPPVSEALEPAETITVTGLGRARGNPDMATVSVGVNVSGEEVGAAVEESNRVMARLTELLAEQGVAASDIQTTNFSIWTEEQRDPATGEPGEGRIYRVESTLQLTVREIDDLGAILETAIANGANNIYGLSFTIEDPGSLADDARAEALRDARQRAEQIAMELGVGLGRVLEVTEVSGGDVTPVYEIGRGVGGGGGEPPISEGSLSVSVSTEVTFELAD